MNKLQRLEVLKDLVQEGVDRGATSIEQIHQYIADLPFEALEKSGLLENDPSTGSRQATLKLREKNQRTIGMVYDAIRRINRTIGELISDQFENLEDADHAAKVLSARRKKKPAR